MSSRLLDFLCQPPHGLRVHLERRYLQHRFVVSHGVGKEGVQCWEPDRLAPHERAILKHQPPEQAKVVLSGFIAHIERPTRDLQDTAI